MTAVIRGSIRRIRDFRKKKAGNLPAKPLFPFQKDASMLKYKWCCHTVGGETKPLKGGDADDTVRFFYVRVYGHDLHLGLESIKKDAACSPKR